MLRTHPLRRQLRRHWLHALALTGQQQSRAVRLDRLNPAHVAQRSDDRVQITLKPQLALLQLSCFLLFYPSDIGMVSDTVKVWPGSFWSVGQQPCRENLRARIDSTSILRKGAYKTQSPCPSLRL